MELEPILVGHWVFCLIAPRQAENSGHCRYWSSTFKALVT